MNLNEPIINQITKNVPQFAQETISNAADSVSSSLANITESVKSGLNDFSEQPANLAGATSDFFSSNSMLAKVSFIMLVLIVFLFIIKLGVVLIGYFTSKSVNPFLIAGKINGNTNLTIVQNPTDINSVLINRSNDGSSGLECTWSVWLYIDEPIQVSSPVKHHSIFVKGSGAFDTTTGLSSSMSPGLYTYVDSSGNCVLHMEFNSLDKTENGVITINHVPLKKWVHIAIRLQNTIMDAYVNGSIANRVNMKIAPKQNYYDVQICPNGGFSGELSNLRYYSHALSIFELTNIVRSGPNLSAATNTADSSQTSGNFTYLSNYWYNINQ